MSKKPKNTFESIAISIKALPKYFSELSPEDTIEALKSVKDRGLRWTGASSQELLVTSEERGALNAALIQNIEKCTPAQLQQTLSVLSETQILWTALIKYIRIGIAFALYNNLPRLFPQELAAILKALGMLRCFWAETQETLQFLFFEALKSQIHNMKSNEVVDSFVGLANMGLTWDLLSNKIKDQFVDALENGLTQFTANETKNLFLAAAKMGEPTRKRKQIIDVLAFLLEKHIKRFDKVEAKALWKSCKALKINKKQTGNVSHLLLWEKAFPEITRKQEQRLERAKEFSQQPATYESPAPYHDYDPCRQWRQGR